MGLPELTDRTCMLCVISRGLDVGCFAIGSIPKIHPKGKTIRSKWMSVDSKRDTLGLTLTSIFRRMVQS